MEQENVFEFLLVLGFEKFFNRGFGEGGKSFIRRSEDGEGAVFRQSLRQTGSLCGGKQSLKIAGFLRPLDEVFLAAFRGGQGQQ
jgi:hypothetical protein